MLKAALERQQVVEGFGLVAVSDRLVADSRLHDVHRLLEAVQRQFSVVFHLSKQARLHDRLR